MAVAILDAGPLVAFFDRAEQHHRWVTERIDGLDAPLLLCEPVLAEAMYLLSRQSEVKDKVLAFIQNGAFNIAFQVDEHIAALRKLLKRYRDVPMSLADGCVVRMAEIYDGCAVLTLDSDFFAYRKHGRVPLALIHPKLQVH
jgi:uncharacterized protein